MSWGGEERLLHGLRQEARGITVMLHERQGVRNHRQLDCFFGSLFNITKERTNVPRYVLVWAEPTGGRWIMPTHRASTVQNVPISWWRHQMETFSALLAICAGNSPVPGEFPAQRPVTRSFDVFFDLRLNKRLSKQSWGWWFETLPGPLWRHSNVVTSSRRVWDTVCDWTVPSLEWLIG